jgi:hypothetical protein
MNQKLEFDCTGAGDRVAVNDFLSQTIRGLRQKAFTLTSERRPDGSFSITIAGDGSAPGEAKPALPKQTRKRALKNAAVEEPTTTTECCGPE